MATDCSLSIAMDSAEIDLAFDQIDGTTRHLRTLTASISEGLLDTGRVCFQLEISSD